MRTGDPRQPFPEEMNRVLTSRLAAIHFAATESAAENLRNEGVGKEHIFVTGNTGIDAVLSVRDSLPAVEADHSKKITWSPRIGARATGPDSCGSAGRGAGLRSGMMI